MRPIHPCPHPCPHRALTKNYVLTNFPKQTYFTQKGLLSKALWLGRQTNVIGTKGISPG